MARSRLENGLSAYAPPADPTGAAAEPADPSAPPLSENGTRNGASSRAPVPEVVLAAAQELLRALAEGSTDAVYVKDLSGNYLMINAAGAAMLGRTPAEVVGRNDAEIFSLEAAALIQATDREIILSGLTQTTERTSLIRPAREGEPPVERRFLTSKWVHHDPEGRPLALVGVARDVTEQRRAETALRDAERRARDMAERMRAVAAAAAGVIGADSVAALQEVLGTACRSVIPFDRFTFGLYDQAGQALSFVGSSWFGTEPTTIPLEGTPAQSVVSSRRSLLTDGSGVPDGTAAAIHTAILSGDLVLGVLSVQSDAHGQYDQKDVEVLEAVAALAATALRNIRLLGDLRRSEAELGFRAFHDALTGLPNRSLFLDRVTHALARAKREGTMPAVLFLDLDNFKTVNDSIGHAEGDRLLRLAADRLRACVRQGDTIARLGGDEFAVLLQDAKSQLDAEIVAERITTEFAIPFDLAGTAVLAGASVGIALAKSASPPDALLRDADVAMYSAKSRGKGCYAVFEPSMHAAVLLRLQLESDLRRAVERDEFVLEYQPIVRLATGEIVGVEALVRWRHPERGLVAPGEFIAAAEDTGLIVPLGEIVLREACRQGATWRALLPAGAPFTMTVNVSGRQLHDPAVTYTVQQALADAQLAPDGLILEITESVLMQNSDATLRKLQAIRELGCALALDDFGTGYSSLAYLQRFPLDILKIDKIFVDALGSGTKTSGLARAIILLGQTLGLQTIAEGIEAGTQSAQLRVLGCELGQGYHFSGALSPEHITAMLTTGRRHIADVDLAQRW